MSKEKEIKVEGAADETKSAKAQANATKDTHTESEAKTNAENKEEDEENALDKANKELAELKDKYLRTLAEFDNFKKRTLKEKTDLILNGSEKTIVAILPILDDMERAIANADKAASKEELEEGWELICKKLHKALEGLGVKRIDTDNANFDVDYHEAIAMVPGMGDEKKGKVIDCTQAGYTLNDKVIRHAKVAVGQ